MGLNPLAAFSQAKNISGRRSSSTLPRNLSVTWTFWGATQFTLAFEAANFSITSLSVLWSEPASFIAIKVRTGAMTASLSGHTYQSNSQIR
jgi:hypothetical protein